jgi:HTH-type transcriptional regulator/antitoxin HipB
MDYIVKIPSQLRPLLVAFRKSAGFTQAQVAKRLGITQQTYAQLEAKPEAASMGRLYEVLGIFKVEIVLAQMNGEARPVRKRVESAETGLPEVSKQKLAVKKQEEW